MATEHPVELKAITRADIDAAARFLHQHLNSRVSVRGWSEAMQMPWLEVPPNHGFMLTQSGEVVGVNLAFYATREWGGQSVRVCNLGALCVRVDQRHHALRLIRALLGQRGYEFTDFSPSGNVVALNHRLGFVDLDTTTVVVPNFPRMRRSGARLVTDATELQLLLPEHYTQLQGSAAAHHVAVVTGDRVCHVILRRDRRKGLPLFATILHVSDAELFRRHADLVFGFALRRLRAPLTLLELRVAHHRPRVARQLPVARPKMIKSKRVDPQDVDYLYSELTEVAW